MINIPTCQKLKALRFWRDKSIGTIFNWNCYLSKWHDWYVQTKKELLMSLSLKHTDGISTLCGLLGGQRLGQCAPLIYRNLFTHLTSFQPYKQSATDQCQLESVASTAAALYHGIETDGNVPYNLLTCSWTIKSLIAAYGVRDVFMLHAVIGNKRFL